MSGERDPAVPVPDEAAAAGAGASEDAEDAVCMTDILKQQQHVDAHLLRLSLAKCEFVDGDEGYARRKIWACLTCFRASGRHGGVCEACVTACHADHEIVELGRRYHKCDCGNPELFAATACTCVPGRRFVNEGNRYGHNFEGRFCSCDKAYNEDGETDTMFQCVGCEDWFHSRHIGTPVPPGSSFDDFLCKGCITGPLRFLTRYAGLAVNADSLVPAKLEVAPPSEEGEDADVSISESGAAEPASDESKAEPAPASDPDAVPCNGWKEQRVEVALFFPNSWRDLLCKCASCQSLMAAKGVPYLLQQDDEVKQDQVEQTFDDNAPAAAAVYEHKLMEKLAAHHDRAAVAALVQGYATLRDKVLGALRTKKRGLVTKGDIEAALEGVLPRPAKRQRTA